MMSSLRVVTVDANVLVAIVRMIRNIKKNKLKPLQSIFTHNLGNIFPWSLPLVAWQFE